MNDGGSQPMGTRLTLEIRHGGCWAIEATERAAGGILAHAIYNSPKTQGNMPTSVNGLFTAYGTSEGEVEELLRAVAATEHAGEILELQERFGRAHNAPGNVVREFFLEYDPNDMVCPTLLEHGFVHSAPVRIADGREEWQVCFAGDRRDIEPSLDEVRERANAEVSVTSITTSEGAERSAWGPRQDALTRRQRDVFEHARELGYYEWPREVSTRELAERFDVSKTTLLEHLRTAESKLLDP